LDSTGLQWENAPYTHPFAVPCRAALSSFGGLIFRYGSVISKSPRLKIMGSYVEKFSGFDI
jgi:hypothetical protein